MERGATPSQKADGMPSSSMMDPGMLWGQMSGNPNPIAGGQLPSNGAPGGIGGLTAAAGAVGVAGAARAAALGPTNASPINFIIVGGLIIAALIIIIAIGYAMVRVYHGPSEQIRNSRESAHDRGGRGRRQSSRDESSGEESEESEEESDDEGRSRYSSRQTRVPGSRVNYAPPFPKNDGGSRRDNYRGPGERAIPPQSLGKVIMPAQDSDGRRYIPPNEIAGFAQRARRAAARQPRGGDGDGRTRRSSGKKTRSTAQDDGPSQDDGVGDKLIEQLHPNTPSNFTPPDGSLPSPTYHPPLPTANRANASRRAAAHSSGEILQGILEEEGDEDE